MGLPTDVKLFLKTEFADAFYNADGAVDSTVTNTEPAFELMVVDWMWHLYMFSGQVTLHTTGRDLIEYAWREVENFLHTDHSRVCVLCFDCSRNVPNAKANTQTKRRVKVAEPLEVQEINDDTFPRPYTTALSSGKIRNDIIEYIICGLHQRAADVDRCLSSDAGGKQWRHRSFELITQWTDVQRTVVGGFQANKLSPLPSAHPEEIDDTGSGEADVGMAFWLKRYETMSAVVRVQDTDQFCILLLATEMLTKSVPRFMCLISRTGTFHPRNRIDETMGEFLCAEYNTNKRKRAPDGSIVRRRVIDALLDMGPEQCDIVDLNRLYQLVDATYGSVDTFVLTLIMQKTDFANKILTFAGVANTLKQFFFTLQQPATSDARPIVIETETDLHTTYELNTDRLKQVLRNVEKQFSGRGSSSVPLKFGKTNARVRLLHGWESELRRVWWNWMFWKTAACTWQGKRPGFLDPARVSGTDNKHMNGWTADGTRVTEDDHISITCSSCVINKQFLCTE